MWNVLVLGFALVFLEIDSVAFLHFGLLCLRQASWPFRTSARWLHGIFACSLARSAVVLGGCAQ